MNHSIGGLVNVDLTAGLCGVLDAIVVVALWIIYTGLCPVKLSKASTKEIRLVIRQAKDTEGVNSTVWSVC